MQAWSFKSGGTILAFHGLLTEDCPGVGSAHIPFSTFCQWIRLARRLGEIVPLSELVRRHQTGRRTAGLVSITFDDAYAVLAQSECIRFLTRERLPITIFVVTSAAARGAAYWWDRVDDLFVRVSPERWRTFEIECGLPDEYRKKQPRADGPVRPLRQWILAAYAGRWPVELQDALAALEHDAAHRTRQRSMTYDELAIVTRLPDVAVGVHTDTHPVLPLLDDVELRREVAVSYDALRSHFAHTLPILAIPFGLYDERTIRIARAAGMETSMTLDGRPVTDAMSKLAIPRVCLTSADTRLSLAAHLVGAREVFRRVGHREAPFPDLPSAST
jgi:peptidoglycan/xylan/chitin deacetylase (PgdA/CDA1 family)